MSRVARAGSFLFEPQAFKNDHAVRVMDPASIGGYVLLLCELWEQPEPGVVPADDRLLASLARMAPETWTLARPQIARAFDTTSRPGFWIQKRMVETHEQQTAWLKSKVELGRLGGIASAKARSSAGQPKAKRRSKQPSSATQAVSGSVSVSGSVLGSEPDSEKRESTPRAVARFTPPTIAEVQAYETQLRAEGRNPVTPEHFIDSYSRTGWKVGKNSMIDWRASYRLTEKWERNGHNGNPGSGKMTGRQIAEAAARMKATEVGHG